MTSRIKSVALVAGGVTFALLLWIAVSQAKVVKPAPAGHHRPVVVQPLAAEAATRLESLPCFKCHNLTRFRKGRDEFSHDQHRKEGLTHCHHCHALTGHFRVTVRRDTCARCH